MLVLSVVGTACTARGRAARPDGMDRTLRVTEADIRRDAQLLAMLDTRRPDSLLMDSLLADGSAPRRARAALAIGQLRMSARYPQLRRLLTDGDTTIAANAAFALGVAKDSLAVDALAAAVGGAPDVVAREAAWSLGEIGEPSRAVLDVVLGDGQPAPLRSSAAALRSAPVRAALVLATVKLRPAPVALVLPWLADTAPEVVRAAAYVVGRLRAPAGARAVIGVRAHPDEEVRQHVARALVRATAGDSLGPLALNVLSGLLRDGDWRVRVNAVRSLSTFGAMAAADVERAFDDTVANVRVAAAESLSVVFERDTIRWRSAWRRDTLLAVRRQLLLQTRRLGLPLFDREAAGWESNRDWRYRMAAVDARVRGTDDERVAVAERHLSDPDPRIRSAVLQRVGATADSAAAARARLVAERAASDPDSIVRAIAQRMLQPASASTRSPRRAGGESALPLRPLADYERLVRRWGPHGKQPPVAVLETDHGVITLQLFSDEAPLIVEAFVRLAESGYYRNTTFHRVVPNFVVQDGDARGDGSGSAGFALRESYSRQRHERGCLGLATSGPDTGGSQYYLCHASQPHLDGTYTVFGRILSGFDVMDRIVQGDRMIRVRIR
jgi:cyclophilin family peptidyl-prolyl cis-trans isomerase/HEAT repeat protein